MGENKRSVSEPETSQRDRCTYWLKGRQLTVSFILAVSLLFTAEARAKDAAELCRAAKIVAVGKFAAAELKCHAKAAKQGVGVDVSCLQRALDKLHSTFDGIETAGGCATVGDLRPVAAASDCTQGRLVATANTAAKVLKLLKKEPKSTSALIDKVGTLVNTKYSAALDAVYLEATDCASSGITLSADAYGLALPLIEDLAGQVVATPITLPDPTEIDSAGGSVVNAVEGLSVTVPAGAFVDPTAVSITRVPKSAVLARLLALNALPDSGEDILAAVQLGVDFTAPHPNLPLTITVQPSASKLDAIEWTASLIEPSMITGFADSRPAALRNLGAVARDAQGAVVVEIPPDFFGSPPGVVVIKPVPPGVPCILQCAQNVRLCVQNGLTPTGQFPDPACTPLTDWSASTVSPTACRDFDNPPPFFNASFLCPLAEGVLLSVRGPNCGPLQVGVPACCTGPRCATCQSAYRDVFVDLPPQCYVPGNTLLNAGFENGVGAQPDAWTYESFVRYSSADPSGLWPVAGHGGGSGVMISHQQLNDSRFYQPVTVRPNTNYRVSGWIKTLDVTQGPEVVFGGANIGILERSIGPLTYVRGGNLFGTHDWTYVFVDFNSGTETQLNIDVRLGMYSGEVTGTAWFDDVKIEERP